MNQSEFIKELKKINIELSIDQQIQFEKYYNLLIDWNKKINLTSITNKEEVYLKHFYDCIAITKIIDLKSFDTLCDIGSGAGFPGIVLKIIFPDLKITLIDSLNKRISFLNEVIKELNLEKIIAVHARAEEFAKYNIECFDVVTARAVSHLSTLLEYGVPMLKVNGYFIAMKGMFDQEKVESYNALKVLNSKIVQVENYKLPFENSNRTLVKIIKKEKTDKKYPRRNIEIKKNRL